MYLRKTLLASFAAALLAVPMLVWAASLEVRDAAVSTGVSERVPTGISSYFDSGVGRLFAYTRIVGADGKMAGFAGGLKRKCYLLSLEAASK